jgi:protein subunit release factor A
MGADRGVGRTPLFSVSKEAGDFIVEYFSGTGSGGQNRNHNCMCCRIRHPASGALATCTEERSQKTNRERAFRRIVEHPKFKGWLKREISRRSGEMALIEAEVERSMRHVRTETKDAHGVWVENDSLGPDKGTGTGREGNG